MLYKISSCLFAVCSLVACSSSKKTTNPESEINLPASYMADVSIDGKADEWKLVPQDFSPRSTLQLSLANNNTSLFIMMRIPGQMEQTKLMRGGMDIWIDEQDKKDKKTGISYPVKGELAETERPQLSPGEKPDLKLMHYQMAGQLISLNRFGFKDQYNGVQSIRQNTGFKAALGWDENDVMIYELTIPLNAFPGEINKNNISIGFNIHGVDRPKNPRAENTAISEGGGGSGRGMGGGGHRAGGNFGNKRSAANLRAETTAYNQREKLYIPESFWAHYTLNHQ